MEKETSEQSVEKIAQEEARLKLQDSLFFLDSYGLMREGPRSIFLESLKHLIRDPRSCLFHETDCSNQDEALAFLNTDKIDPKDQKTSFSLTPWWWSKKAEQHDQGIKDGFHMCMMLGREKSLEIKKEFVSDNLRASDPKDELAKHLFDECLEVRTDQGVAPKDFNAIFLRLFKWGDLDPAGIKKLNTRRQEVSLKWQEYSLGHDRVNDADFGLYLRDVSEIEELEARLVEDYYEKNPDELKRMLSIATQIGVSAGIPVFDYHGNLLFPSQIKRKDLKSHLAPLEEKSF